MVRVREHLVEADDEAQGLKMVLVEELKLGEESLPGVGGLVLVNDPPEANLSTLLRVTGFELGGYLNMALIKNWKVRVNMGAGKVEIEAAAPPPAEG